MKCYFYIINIFLYMKHLREYIFENISNKTVYLLKTLDDAKDFFKRKLKNGITLQDDAGISDEQLEALYEYCHEKNMPAPIVGCYGNTLYNFAFRRWFNENIQSEIKDKNGDSFVFNKSSKYFKNYHNTSLKEDGKFVPTAQDFEELICFAYNKQYKIFNSDEENYNAVGISSNKKDNLLNYYKVNSNVINKLAEVLHKSCPCLKGYGKLKNFKGTKITKEWAELYDAGVTPNATPKTDIISLDNKYCISLKEFGGSQLMSAKLNEAKATLLFACDYLDDKDVKEILPILANLLNINESDKKRKENTEDIFDEFGPDDLHGKTLSQMIKDDPEFAKRIKKSKEKGKNFEKQLNELIISKYPKYKEALYKEAMTGIHKFTKDSHCAANCVFVWDDVKIENTKLYSIDEYYEHIKDKSKVSVDFKSWPTSNRSGQTLKIITQ